jgi:NAD(P)-dependent dehydrogenase (short-subunit alcohol dehydrogenase family)
MTLRFAAPFERRVALVTGGARGIGRACALRLAQAGRDVAILDVGDGIAEVCGEIETLGQKAVALPVDVRDEAAVHAAVAQVIAHWERLDILVCCAGVLGKEQDFSAQSVAEFDRVMQINVYGVYHAHQAAIPHMLVRGWGRCVTITSGARLGAPQLVPYATSKGAVHALVSSLGNAYPRQGVLVNGVEPGRALTEMVVPRFSAEFLANPPNTPIGRYSDADEVAEVVEFLCSERNTYTTGSVWSCKGGAG